MYRLFCISLFIGLCVESSAQFGDGAFMAQAINETFETAAFIESQSSFGFDEGVCILAGLVRRSDYVRWSTSLEYGKEYAIIGGGDSDAQDVDIKVIDPNGKVVVTDTETDNNPIVSFTASVNGNYVIELKLYACKQEYSYCSMAILEEGGISVPHSNLESTLETLGGNWISAYNLYPNLSFVQERNQWSIFGVILDKGDHSSISNLNLGYGQAIAVGAADGNSTDVDICFLSDYGDRLECDQETDANPVVSLDVSSKAKYTLKTTNYAGDKSLIISSILKLN